jgi:integrase
MAEGRAVMRSIVNQWGERSIALLKVEEILMYVSGLERSGSYKRNFMCKVKELYREACWYGCNIPVPSFPSFKKNTRKADIFTEDELRSYFNPELYADQNLYLFYLCCLTAALRPGEARGLRPKQILFDKKALVVDGFVKKNGVRTGYDEKRTGDYTKLRIVPLPDLALRLLKEHIDRKGLQTGDFCFTAKKDPSRPIPESSIRDTMARIIKKTGIQTRGRKLAINSFRYTYATYMLRELPAGTVMKLVGHRMTGITEYYRKRGIDESLAGLTGAEKAVEKLLT